LPREAAASGVLKALLRLVWLISLIASAWVIALLLRILLMPTITKSLICLNGEGLHALRHFFNLSQTLLTGGKLIIGHGCPPGFRMSIPRSLLVFLARLVLFIAGLTLRGI
jgi:hypothetical protein